MKTRRLARDARTGQIVTIAYAQRHPETTVIEEVEVREKPAPETGQKPLDDDTAGLD